MDDMIVDDTSTDLEALRDELRFDMVLLHSEVMKLDKTWDFSDIIKPLMVDQGPPILVVPRIKKQIERLQKLRDDYYRTARDLQRPAPALAEAAPSLYVAEPPNTKTRKMKDRPVQPKSQPTEPRRPPLPPQEELPPWGHCKRYCAMSETQYHRILEIAKTIYDMILHSTDPRQFRQKELTKELLAAVTNRWLTFQNIKDAALDQNFSLIKIGYNRNEAMLAAKAETDPARQAFVEWAVDFIRTNTTRRKISREALLAAWTKHDRQTCATSFFITTQGTPLNMVQLRMQAFPNGQRRPAAASPGSEYDWGRGGSGADSDFNPDGSEWPNESFHAAPAWGEARKAAAEKEKEVHDSFPASPPGTAFLVDGRVLPLALERRKRVDSPPRGPTPPLPQTGPR